MMGYRLAFPDDTAEQMRRALNEVRSADEVKKIQCILLRAELNLTPRQIASVTGLDVRAVWKLHSAYLHSGIDALFTAPARQGGRYHAYLPIEEEKMFLETLLGTDRSRLTHSVTRIKKAFEKRVGKTVNRSTLYNMLHRNGWQIKQQGEK